MSLGRCRPRALMLFRRSAKLVVPPLRLRALLSRTARQRLNISPRSSGNRQPEPGRACPSPATPPSLKQHWQLFLLSLIHSSLNQDVIHRSSPSLCRRIPHGRDWPAQGRGSDRNWSEYSQRQSPTQLNIRPDSFLPLQAAQGIGKATALVFAREGAKVVVSDLDLGQSPPAPSPSYPPSS